MSRLKIQNKKGFTLLELLVVIAIIGVLSSVVMVSLSNAKSKARKAAFLSGLDQFTKLMQMEYEAYGSYVGLDSGGWVPSSPTTNTCDVQYGPSSSKTSQHKTQAYNLCNQIVNNSGEPNYPFIIGAQTNSYSVSGWNGGDNLYYCMGTIGKTMGIPWVTGGVGVYQHIGCIGNY